jgi:hypothetical protein
MANLLRQAGYMSALQVLERASERSARCRVSTLRRLHETNLMVHECFIAGAKLAAAISAGTSPALNQQARMDYGFGYA